MNNTILFGNGKKIVRKSPVEAANVHVQNAPENEKHIFESGDVFCESGLNFRFQMCHFVRFKQYSHKRRKTYFGCTLFDFEYFESSGCSCQF